LQKVAAELKTFERDERDYAARWGGEEFVMLLSDTDIDEVFNVAEAIRKRVESLVIPTEAGEETKVTLSAGINAIYPEETNTYADLIEKADQALYRAKEEGRNRVTRS